MRRIGLSSAFLGLLCLFCQCRQPDTRANPGVAKTSHPSPVVVAVAGGFALTANHGADSVSLVDLEKGEVVSEAAVGQKPSGLAISRDGQRAVVTSLWSGTATLLAVAEGRLLKLASVHVGAFPRGAAFAPDGSHVYLAVAGDDEVIEVAWTSRKVTRRWPAPREPREVVVSADGRWLAAVSSRTSQVRLWDLSTGKQVWERVVPDGFNLRGLQFTPDGEHLVVAHAVRRDLPVTKHNIEEGWVIDTRLSRFAVNDDVRPGSWQVALDLRAQAVADPSAMAFSPNGDILAISTGGTQELILLQKDGITWNGGDPGDFMDFATEKKTRKIPLGGRPMGVAFSPRTGQAVIANYMLDALQIVDVGSDKIVKTIPLGGPKEIGVARKGEGLFYDAKRSHHQWMSCNTCHVDGHTVGLNFDTLNDDAYGSPQLTPSLRNVAKTAPYTWHGWQKDLGAGVKKSFTETMFGKEPTKDEVSAVVAFLETLTAPPHPKGTQLSEAAQRGKLLFQDKARCARCHRGEYFTSANNFDLKTEPDGSPYDLWNPPSLIGLYDRGPYLHNGRAKTLDDVLRYHHTSEMLGGQRLTDAERADLIHYLLAL